MDINNLTSVYNQNPTLQSQYTLQQYLDMFGGSSTPTPTPTPTPTVPDQGIINAGINQFQNQGGNNQINVQSFRTDPRVGGALEAYDRNKQLTSMGINDPFANEISLQDAYYDDMPNFDDSPGSQSMMNKIKSGIGKAMQYTPSRMIGNIAMKGLNALGKYLPVNERAIRENIQGNLGVRVDDIGRIVNTGNYSDPENIMAGYSNPTEKTFDKRIDKTSETLSSKYGLSQQQINGILDGTLNDDEMENINNLAFNKTMGKTTNLVKQLRSLNIAKDRSKFANNIAKKEVERKKQEKEAKAIEQIRQQYAAQGRDYGQGAASQATQDSYGKDSGGNPGNYDQDYDMKDGGYIDGTNRRKTNYFKGGVVSLRDGGRINFRGGGMDMGNASNQAKSASSTGTSSKTTKTSTSPFSSGNQGATKTFKTINNRGGGGGPKPGSGRVNTINRYGPKNKSFFDKMNIHSMNNAKLEQALRDGLIDSDEYNVLGGLSSKRDLGFGPVLTGAASTGYNLVQSALGPKFSRGNQPLFDGASDIGRNTYGATLEPDSALAKQYDEIMKTYKRGGSVRKYFKGGLVSLRGK